jgi:hypothetical protein
MPKIDSVQHGEIVVDGEKYEFDVWVFTDGRVMERQAISRDKVAPDEVQTMIDNCEGLQELVIAGDKELPVDQEAIELATGKKILLAQCNLSELAEFFNKEAESKKIGAIVLVK